jgi:ligand-binding SRPBCC domain-containing protein
MAEYERTVRVRAPFEEVWAFHSEITGLEALTPDWLNLRIESVTRPDDGDDTAVLVEDTRIESSVQPFGVGPRQGWTSVIEDRQERDGAAWFSDSMADGPFREYQHTHTFFADGDETVVHDHVRYELPFGGLGRRLGPLAVVGFEPMFRYRHRRTKALLES